MSIKIRLNRKLRVDKPKITKKFLVEDKRPWLSLKMTTIHVEIKKNIWSIEQTRSERSVHYREYLRFGEESSQAFLQLAQNDPNTNSEWADPGQPPQPCSKPTATQLSPNKSPIPMEFSGIRSLIPACSLPSPSHSSLELCSVILGMVEFYLLSGCFWCLGMIG